MKGQEDTRVSVPRAEELASRSMVCHGLAAEAYVQSARAEAETAKQASSRYMPMSARDADRHQLQHYLRVREHAQAFHSLMVKQRKSSQDVTNIQQMSERSLRNDFEAALHLKLWDDLEKIIEVGKTPRFCCHR